MWQSKFHFFIYVENIEMFKFVKNKAIDMDLLSLYFINRPSPFSLNPVIEIPTLCNFVRK